MLCTIVSFNVYRSEVQMLSPFFYVKAGIGLNLQTLILCNISWLNNGTTAEYWSEFKSMLQHFTADDHGRNHLFVLV